MLDPAQFRRHVIRPALLKRSLHSPAAEVLLLGTALTESGLEHLIQRGGGPALGPYQVEPATHTDIWLSYLAFRPARAARVASLAAGLKPSAAQLVWNLGYATVIARLVYYRAPEPLPAAHDIGALAAYWKAHFNTGAGKGDPRDFIARAGPHLYDPGARRRP